MHVVHVVPAAPYGGAQKVVRDLASKQVRSGMNVSVVWTGEPQPTVAATESDRVNTYCVSGTLLEKSVRLWCLFRDLSPDVVHLHMAPPWVTPLLPIDRSAIVVHLHSVPSKPKTLKAWIGATFQSIAIRRADVLLPVSRWVENQWRALYPRAHYELVFNGIPSAAGETCTPHALSKETTRIGFASRLAEGKGVEEFADFAIEFHKLCPKAEFLIAGDGPLRPLLKHRTVPLAECGRIKFLGFVEDMTQFWPQIDLSVFCADKEPFGLRLIEPIVHGVPVVAYRTGAGSDEIVDLCSAITAVPYGEPLALAELAASILSDDMTLTEIVNRGRQEVMANFSLETMSMQVEQAYAAAQNGRRQRRP